jgi:hypothetical protein
VLGLAAMCSLGSQADFLEIEGGFITEERVSIHGQVFCVEGDFSADYG